MSGYADIDAVIEHWVKATGSTLFTEWAGKPVRFFYLKGEPPFECFQIAIAPPEGGNLTVLASSIDTNDDSEMEQAWEGPVEDIDAILQAATAMVEVWTKRALASAAL